jgi:hypothetical protein
MNTPLFCQPRQQMQLHPSLQGINPRMSHNPLEKKPAPPSAPAKKEAPVRAIPESKGSGLSTEKKRKVTEFLKFEL